jgi:hypothetical protein
MPLKNVTIAHDDAHPAGSVSGHYFTSQECIQCGNTFDALEAVASCGLSVACGPFTQSDAELKLLTLGVKSLQAIISGYEQDEDARSLYERLGRLHAALAGLLSVG